MKHQWGIIFVVVLFYFQRIWKNGHVGEGGFQFQISISVTRIPAEKKEERKGKKGGGN